MMHATSLTKTVFWGHWLAPVTPPEHLPGPGLVSYATFHFQFGASILHLLLLRKSQVVKYGRTHLAGRGVQMALISLNGPDEPHLDPPHPQGPRSPFQLSCEGAHSPRSCYSELSWAASRYSLRRVAFSPWLMNTEVVSAGVYSVW